MITAIPNGKHISVNSEGAVTYIAPLNARAFGVPCAMIPESTTKKIFTVTDALDYPADEVLNFDCDHVIITRKAVNSKWLYSGVIIGLTNNNENRFLVKKLLSHLDCTTFIKEKEGTVVSNYTYSGMCNDSKSEERRRAKELLRMENIEWVN